MGTITLPTSGSVYVDANALIYRVEMIEPYLTASMPLWDALDANQQNVVTSELSVLEVLVKPLRLADLVLEGLFTGTLYSTPGLACVPITQSILRTAAPIRADVGLKTPDAIHAASPASMLRCLMKLLPALKILWPTTSSTTVNSNWSTNWPGAFLRANANTTRE